MLKKVLFCCALFFVVLPAHAQETATVLVEGIGKDIEKAVQRAAEAALTQVVGSFIDSDKLIKKRKEIRNGIKTQTKSISSKLSEYSQGSIQRLDVLEVEEEGGLTRVTAKVTVRIEDFKHYIKETVLAEKKIKKGLLGKLKVGDKQKKNLSQLLIDKVLNPVLDYQVVIPKIVSEIKAMENPRILKAFGPGDGEHVIYFYVEVTLNPDYLANAKRVLEETAIKRFNLRNYPELKSNAHQWKKGFSAVIAVGAPFGKPFQDYRSILRGTSGGVWMKPNVNNDSYHQAPTFYAYAAKNTKLCKRLYGALGWTKENQQYPFRCSGIEKCYMLPTLTLRFVSGEGDILRENIISWHRGSYKSDPKPPFSSAVLWRKGSVPLKSVSPPGVVSKSGMTVPLISLGVWRPKVNNSCRLMIMSSTTFVVVTKVSAEVLEKAEKIVLKYSK